MSTVLPCPSPSPTVAPHAIAGTAAKPADVWSVETTYKPTAADHHKAQWPPRLDADALRWHLARDKGSWYTPAFIAALAAETGWERIGVQPELSPDAAALIAEGLPCPLCRSTTGGRVDVRHRGVTTGVEIMRPVRCRCGMNRTFLREWGEMVKVHPRFAGVKLGSLAPDASRSSMPVSKQAEIIALLKAHPEDSFLFIGPPNTGKTHMMAALYRRALGGWATRQWELDIPQLSVWRIGAAQMLDQHVAWETRDRNAAQHGVTVPHVTVAKIQSAVRAGFRPSLFLDELDKVTMSDFKAARLMGIIDAIYEAHGQVVATANKSVAEMTAKWGSDEAGTVLRRIGIGDGAHIVTFCDS